MTQTSVFPLITPQEFEQACSDLQSIFNKADQHQYEWLSVETLHQDESAYFRVTKILPELPPASENSIIETHEEPVEEEDEETLEINYPPQALIHYDITLSPTYQVPVLYFTIKDPNFRFPPTMDTLYRHLIPPQFLKQVQDVGVIGGVTITDHPFTNQPCFFIHPCQTAAVIEASAGSKVLRAVEYLMIWIGAIGGCVGLTLPTVLAVEVDEEKSRAGGEA